jgi:hypothetical protein
MKRLEKIKLIIKEFEKTKTDFPGIRRIEALKKAIIKVKFLEEVEYSENGPKIDDLIGNYNQNDWTY